MATKIDRSDVPLLLNIIRQFRIAISNMRLYPTESEVVQTSIKNLYNSLTTFLNKYKYMTMGFVEGKPIVNKEDISKGLPETVKAGIFLERLNEHNIKTITLRQGLEYSELETFLELLKNKYDPAHTLQDGLRQSKVKRIGVNEKIYTAIGDKDLVIERGEEILSKSKGALDNILSEVEKIVDMTLSVEDPSLREKLKLEIGKKLLFKDPKLLEKLIGKEGGKGGPLENLTQEEIEEHLGELIETYRILKAGRIEETGDRLKELIRNVVDMLKKMDPAFSLSKGLLYRLDEIDGFVKKWEKLSAKDMTTEEEKLAKRILSESSFNVIQEDGTASAIHLLAEKGLWRPAFDIIKKILLGMESLNPSTRAKAVLKLHEVMDVIFMNAEPKEFYFVFIKTLKIFVKETSLEVLEGFAQLLPELAQKAFERGLKNEVIKLLAFINMEIKSEKTSKERLKVLRKIKDGIAGNLKDILLEKIMGQGDIDAFTLKAIYYLGDTIVNDLVELLKNADSREKMGKIVRILSSIGPAAESAILAEVEVEQSPEKLENLLSVVDRFKDRKAVIDTLEITLKAAPSNLKPMIFGKLVELGAENLENFALEFTESEDPDVQELGFEYMLKNAPDRVRDKVEHLLVPKKVLFLKFQQQAYIKVKRRIVELIGETGLLWGIPMVIPQLDHQDRSIKKAAFNTLKQFKPEILRRYEKDIKQVGKSKDPITRDYVKSLLQYIQ